MINKNKRLGEILIEAGSITEEQLQQALDVSKQKGRCWATLGRTRHS
jgi:hypothetical protein